MFHHEVHTTLRNDKNKHTGGLYAAYCLWHSLGFTKVVNDKAVLRYGNWGRGHRHSCTMSRITHIDMRVHARDIACKNRPSGILRKDSILPALLFPIPEHLYSGNDDTGIYKESLAFFCHCCSQDSFFLRCFVTGYFYTVLLERSHYPLSFLFYSPNSLSLFPPFTLSDTKVRSGWDIHYHC